PRLLASQKIAFDYEDDQITTGKKSAHREQPGRSIRIGLSGWSYRHWRSRFYPEGLPASRQLDFVASRFNTVEINRTFYSLVKPAWFQRIADQTPPDFQFAVKGSRFITHMKKLSDVKLALANFFASGLVELGDKLGPILWQLPASFHLDLGRLETFFQLLPRSHRAVADAASIHTRGGIELARPQSDTAVRHALEIRNPSFLSPAVTELATKFEICLAASHSARWPYFERPTTDFMYFRLHGPEALYASPYSDDQLKAWAERLAHWRLSESARGTPFDVYVYFDNDGHAHAPRNALRLQELLMTRAD
ncbi:MAG: DUF72 domain-containing protein, partial [Acidimicrobiia bacterium]